MHSFDIVAYTCEGDIYCPDHIQIDEGDEENGHVSPIFVDGEGWAEHCCSACLAEAVDKGEPVETLGEASGLYPIDPEPRFDRFDIAQAHALYWMLNHGGQWSAGYSKLCRAMALMGEGCRIPSYEGLSDNGRAIYRAI